jgi:hypothetical protein
MLRRRLSHLINHFLKYRLHLRDHRHRHLLR